MTTTITVYSADNHFQHAEVLRRNRHKRQRYREFFLEGVRPINLALAHNWTIRTLLYAPERELSDWGRDVLRRAGAELHLELPGQLLAELSNKSEPSELLAIAAMPDDSLERIPIGARPLVTVFDRPVSPGNLGTLIRSCDALGVDGLIVSGHAADVYDPETISASTGSLFALPVVRVPGPQAVVAWLARVREQAGAVQVVGSDEKGKLEVWEHDWRAPTVLLLGNETWGLSAGFRELCEVMVRIPMSGAASSLNVACAASIMLYEAARQRRASPA